MGEHTNSATAPAVAFVFGLVLAIWGGVAGALLGGVLMLGGGALFVVRLVALFLNRGEP